MLLFAVCLALFVLVYFASNFLSESRTRLIIEINYNFFEMNFRLLFRYNVSHGLVSNLIE